MDLFKDFVIGYCHDSNARISKDERLSVGCMILEYQMPLMEDPYYLEIQVLQFLSELIHLKKPALTAVVFHVYSLCFSEDYLKKWTVSLM